MERTPDLTVTILMKRIDLLEQELLTDRLTRLGNRMALERRSSARGGWFVACDLNGFKRAQDASPFGHLYGDQVLISFADFLRSIVDGTDRLAVRQGGDEFVIWAHDRGEALRIKRAVRGWLSDDGAVSAAAGIGDDLKVADADMYLAKRKRKSVIYECN